MTFELCGRPGRAPGPGGAQAAPASGEAFSFSSLTF